MTWSYRIRRAAYRPLYDRYHVEDAGPYYIQSREIVLGKYTRKGDYGLFMLGDTPVSAVRISVNAQNGAGKVSGLASFPGIRTGGAQEALAVVGGVCMRPSASREKKGLRWISLALLSVGLILLITGLYYVVIKAGIPYQDPTPELLAKYERNMRAGELLSGFGLAALAAGGLLELIRFINKRCRG